MMGPVEVFSAAINIAERANPSPVSCGLVCAMVGERRRRGRSVTPADFDAALPDHVIDAFAGGECACCSIRMPCFCADRTHRLSAEIQAHWKIAI
jgi:hypothetical protein